MKKLAVVSVSILAGVNAGYAQARACVTPTPLAVERIRPDAGAVTGVVTNAEGCPLAGGVVYVLRRPGDARELRLAASTLDSLGRFRFDSLPAGDLWIAVLVIEYLQQVHQLYSAPSAVDTMLVVLRRSRFNLSPIRVPPPEVP
ncbi:hypothetical protein PLCT1_00131 [Planctomycetaceae bacterium]|nr:hypothetical protein PLCT1_00131 [Planctomycetaceae bacterium]